MKNYSTEDVFYAVCIGIFGAVVNVANNIARARRHQHNLSFIDSGVFFVTALFSGLVFGLMAIFFAELLDLGKPSFAQLLLAISIGTVLGWDGLTTVASRAVDAVIYALKK